MSSRRTPSRSATPSRASARIALRIAPCGQRLRHVAADDERQLVLARRAPAAARPCRPGPRGRRRRARRRSARRPPPPPRTSRRGAPRPGPPRPPCAAAAPAGTSSTRSRPSWVSASWPQTRWPRCGGLNVPPSRPTRATSYADLPRALDEVLERAQLAQADRAARVQLLRRVADLRAHAELPAVGEARRGVDVDAPRRRSRAGTPAPRRPSRSRSPRNGLSRTRSRARSPPRRSRRPRTARTSARNSSA